MFLTHHINRLRVFVPTLICGALISSLAWGDPPATINPTAARILSQMRNAGGTGSNAVRTIDPTAASILANTRRADSTSVRTIIPAAARILSQMRNARGAGSNAVRTIDPTALGILGNARSADATDSTRVRTINPAALGILRNARIAGEADSTRVRTLDPTALGILGSMRNASEDDSSTVRTIDPAALGILGSMGSIAPERGEEDDSASDTASDSAEAEDGSRHDASGLDIAVGVIEALGAARRAFGQGGHGYGHFGYGSGQPEYWIPAAGHHGVAAAVPANPLPTPSLPTKPVVLVNPEATNQAVAFLIDGKEGSLDVGQYLELSTADAMIIEFDRGGRFGNAKYSLTEGVFTFKLTDEGWDLNRKTFAVTLDNSSNENAFHYVVDGQAQVVQAGEQQTHHSRLPITVAFDRGNGGESAQAMLPNGTYAIGVSPETNLWDLFLVPPGEGAAN